MVSYRSSMGTRGRVQLPIHIRRLNPASAPFTSCTRRLKDFLIMACCAGLFAVLYMSFSFPGQVEQNSVESPSGIDVERPTKNGEILRKVFAKADAILNEAKIPHFYVFGTALGLIRDKDLMEWDRDVDIGVFYKDIASLDPILLRDRFLAAGFVQTDEYSAPYSWHCNNKVFPILYQFRFSGASQERMLRCDIYVFYEHLGRYWIYAEGGERNGTGLAYPALDMDTISVNGKTHSVSPVSWLELDYGKDWRTPRTSGWEIPHKQEKVQTGSASYDCILPDPSIS